MNPLDAIKPLLQRQARGQDNLVPELGSLFTELLRMLEKIAAGGGTLNDLRKPGASAQRPLPPNTPAQPYFVSTPISIHVVNVSPATLAADLARDGNHATTGPTGVTQVTIPLLLR